MARRDYNSLTPTLLVLNGKVAPNAFGYAITIVFEFSLSYRQLI